MEETQQQRKTTPIYVMDIPCKDEMDILENLIFQYSVSLYLRGRVSIVLRKKLVTLLALYFKYGYNNDTKNMAVKIFGSKPESLNSENHELKEKGYLIDDPISKRRKHLNKELEDLLEFWTKTTEKDEKIMVVKLHMEN